LARTDSEKPAGESGARMARGIAARVYLTHQRPSLREFAGGRAGIFTELSRSVTFEVGSDAASFIEPTSAVQPSEPFTLPPSQNGLPVVGALFGFATVWIGRLVLFADFGDDNPVAALERSAPIRS
jgi:hypothetical protein